LRFPRTTKLAIAAALAITTLPVMAVAAPTPGADPVPVSPEQPVPSEELPAPAAALDAVQEAFEESEGTEPQVVEEVVEDGRDLTLRLRDLNRTYDDLSARDRSIAEGYLARPTDGQSDPDGSGYGPLADPTSNCVSAPDPRAPNFCVTYARATGDSPSGADTNDNGVPDQVDRTRQSLQNVWRRTVTEGGYRAPKDDGGPAQHEGPNKSFDVYLADIGDSGLYGYCNIDSYSVTNGRDLPGYCVLDDDYAPTQFGSENTPVENLQVTIAHEFFHAVQFAYDFEEDGWFMEGTAAWIEDEIYDDVNDNRQYLYRDSPLTHPAKPLDSYGNGFAYGSWVWWRFVTERFPDAGTTGLPLIMRDTWTAAHHDSPTAHGTYSLNAITKTLAARNADITRVFANFGDAIRHPGRGGNFEEGASYPKARLVDTIKLSGSKRSHVTQTASMPHLTNWTIAYKPTTGLAARDWKLKVTVDGPDRVRDPFARLSVHYADDSIASKVIWLSASGVGAEKVPFSTPEVSHVELTLTNAGRRFRCNQGSYLSCQGDSLDDGLQTRFKATAVR
jgi:hypothetical protein